MRLRTDFEALCTRACRKKSSEPYRDLIFFTRHGCTLVQTSLFLLLCVLCCSYVSKGRFTCCRYRSCSADCLTIYSLKVLISETALVKALFARLFLGNESARRPKTIIFAIKMAFVRSTWQQTTCLHCALLFKYVAESDTIYGYLCEIRTVSVVVVLERNVVPIAITKCLNPLE